MNKPEENNCYTKSDLEDGLIFFVVVVVSQGYTRRKGK